MKDLRKGLIRLAHDNPDLRGDILPLLASDSGNSDKAAGVGYDLPTPYGFPDHVWDGAKENAVKSISLLESKWVHFVEADPDDRFGYASFKFGQLRFKLGPDEIFETRDIQKLVRDWSSVVDLVDEYTNVSSPSYRDLKGSVREAGVDASIRGLVFRVVSDMVRSVGVRWR